MQLRFPEEVVAVLADAVQTGEDAPVVHALALNVEERPFAEGMAAKGGGVRAQADAGRDQQQRQRPREDGHQQGTGRPRGRRPRRRRRRRQ